MTDPKGWSEGASDGESEVSVLRSDLDTVGEIGTYDPLG